MLDSIIRDSVFSGLSDLEFVSCVGTEMKRRDMAGIVYMLPLDERGIREAFCASALPASMQHLSVPEALQIIRMHALTMPKETNVTAELKREEDWSKG